MRTKLTKIAHILIILIIGGIGVQTMVSCTTDDGDGGSYGKVSYGGKTYKTVKIGDQTWMAENLNYDVAGGKCYDNDPANCNKYGMGNGNGVAI